MSVRAAILTAILCLAGSRLFSAPLFSLDDQLQPLHGHCSIAPSTQADHVKTFCGRGCGRRTCSEC